MRHRKGVSGSLPHDPELGVKDKAIVIKMAPYEAEAVKHLATWSGVSRGEVLRRLLRKELESSRPTPLAKPRRHAKGISGSLPQNAQRGVKTIQCIVLMSLGEVEAATKLANARGVSRAELIRQLLERAYDIRVEAILAEWAQKRKEDEATVGRRKKGGG